MKVHYKVKVKITMGKILSESYALIETVDDGIDDGKEKEILFESVEEYVKAKVSARDEEDKQE